MAEKTYKVLRQHDGDKPYFAGDERTGDEAELKHLVDLGVLKETTSKPKVVKEKAA